MTSGGGELSAGDLLGDFRILKRIGSGGMGIVYLARDERLERRVALKVIAPALAADAEFRDRFVAEARSAAAIDHDNAVTVYSAGVVDGDLYMAMRFIEGTDLRTALADEGPFDPAAAVAVIADIAAALDAAHAAGLVHRDVKPANILLRGEPSHRTGFLTDFGLTKGGNDPSPSLTGTSQWVGTIDYVAPEQIQSGRIDARTDVYALGCVLYEMLAGSVPYTGNEMQKMWGHVNEPFPRLTAQGPAADHLGAVIERATAKDPADRFPSAGDLANAARAAVGGDEVEVPEHSVAAGAAATGLAETVTARKAPVPTQGRTVVGGPTAPGPRDLPTRQLPSPGQPRRGSAARLGAIVGAAALIAAGLVVAALVIAGDDEASPAKTAAATGKAPKPQPRPTEGLGAGDPRLPASRAECADGVYVKERVAGVPYTSCPFAGEVARLYSSGGGSQFTATSPVTGDEYDMSCDGVETVRCTDGGTAVVYIVPEFYGETPATAEMQSAPEAEPEPAQISSEDNGELGDWPGGSAYSAMLGAFSSEWRARSRQQEASERGLDAGVLYSSNFSSLTPGYWIVFSGSFPSSSEAAERARRARSLGYSDSYPRFVSP